MMNAPPPPLKKPKVESEERMMNAPLPPLKKPKVESEERMMNGPPPPLKKPKVESEENTNGEIPVGTPEANASADDSISDEDEQAIMIALIKHRTHEVEHNRTRMKYYQDQLAKSEKSLEDVKAKYARFRRQNNTSEKLQTHDFKSSRDSPAPNEVKRDPPQSQLQAKPKLLSPSVKPKTSQTPRIEDSTPVSRVKNSQTLRIEDSTPVSKVKTSQNVKTEGSTLVGKVKTTQTVPMEDSGRKRKHEQKEHTELISMIRRSSSATKVNCQTGCVISSQHKRKMRSLILCPTNDQLFMTSALDGVINLWQLHGRGSGASLLSSTDSVSPKERRWPEDTAWHPDGDCLFSVYSADGGDSQISLLNLNKTKAGRVCFLENKPHFKGIINNIVFMPWENPCFVTGGSDHAVVVWTDKEGDWKPKALHRNLHSSAVMGVAGMQQKQIVLSVGADKRIIGFDAAVGRADYRHQIDSKCMSVVPNPCDFNLFMVQTGTPEKQLRLFDIRLRRAEIHAFGWKQESSESQSALINQDWSPDGLYITSGSADPAIHIFDIRYPGNKPSQSVKAHNKRVFKAAWHQNYPLLISISSDLNIELHKIT
ncbi:uncharacterized protein LOC124915233 [Impatiens glandulifera]|uniref:uncharacterized protein LOC124915233 n=1 Tax=Impatiens glandulifera TaxID=253017 RepID=UPI001FB17AA1|nr:uncharacterized protein LOC124915233 [Impatiens glandulifera]